MDGRWTLEPVTADRLLFVGTGEFNAIIVLTSADGGDVSLYDGLDANSGRLLGTFKGSANLSLPIVLYPPIPIERGLYVDVGTSITSIIVGYRRT